MSGVWALKRFWKEVTVEPHGTGFAVALDGKHLRTPGKVELILPTRALADLVAAEWQVQTGAVQFASMQATRTANSAVDTVPRHRAAIVADLAGYGGMDLVCYRAEEPAGLRSRQAAAWDPLIAWAGSRFGTSLKTGNGVIPIAQSDITLRALTQEVARQNDFQLAAFHDLVALSGSLVIALSVVEGVQSPEAGWALSRIDETWQAEAWGEDDEALRSAHIKRDAFVAAAKFHALSV